MSSLRVLCLSIRGRDPVCRLSTVPTLGLGADNLRDGYGRDGAVEVYGTFCTKGTLVTKKVRIIKRGKST